MFIRGYFRFVKNVNGVKGIYAFMGILLQVVRPPYGMGPCVCPRGVFAIAWWGLFPKVFFCPSMGEVRSSANGARGCRWVTCNGEGRA